jgi:hypothetical protein
MNTTIKGLFKGNIFISMILKTYFDSFESHFCDIRHVILDTNHFEKNQTMF